MKERLLEWQQKIDALTQRERVILFATAVVAVIMLIQLVLIDPVLAKRKQLARQQQQLESQIVQQRAEQQMIAAVLGGGVNREKIAHRDNLKATVEDLDKKIQSSVLALIPPQLMAEVLESILKQTEQLKLTGLENLPVEPVLEQAAAEGSTSKQGLYRHRFSMSLTGEYSSVIAYLEKLTALPWRFHWDSLFYEVSEYPKATIKLDVHTVSMSEEWIGV